MGGKPEDLQTAAITSSVLGLGGSIAGLATGKRGIGQPFTQLSGTLSEAASQQTGREIQLQRLLQQQQQQAFYRQQSEAAGKRAQEQLSMGRERLNLSKEQADLARKTAARQEEQYQYEKEQRPLKQEASQLEIDIKKQNIAQGKKAELGPVDFAYSQIMQENPELKKDPEGFGYALKSKLPNLSESELEGAVEGLRRRGKLLQPASYWNSVKTSIKNMFKVSNEQVTKPTITTTTMPSGLTPEQEARRQELLRRKGQ